VHARLSGRRSGRPPDHQLVDRRGNPRHVCFRLARRDGARRNRRCYLARGRRERRVVCPGGDAARGAERDERGRIREELDAHVGRRAVVHTNFYDDESQPKWLWHVSAGGCLLHAKELGQGEEIDGVAATPEGLIVLGQTGSVGPVMARRFDTALAPLGEYPIGAAIGGAPGRMRAGATRDGPRRALSPGDAGLRCKGRIALANALSVTAMPCALPAACRPEAEVLRRHSERAGSFDTSAPAPSSPRTSPSKREAT
jgi:hypothetical protein